MYKNFSITEEERNQIMESHKMYGYRQPMNESTQPPKKLLPAISHMKLQNIPPSTSTVKTNQNILTQLQNKQIVADPRQLNFDVNDKNFLSKISQFIQSKGFTPYLNVNTDQLGNSQSVNAGVTFSVPKLGIDLSVERGYFGASKELPFLNGATITGSYTPGANGDYAGTGYKSTTNPNSSYTLSNRFNVGLTIPIGR
jgi:hypothetical protein